MAVAYECDICAKLVYSLTRKLPEEYFTLDFSGGIDEESGFPQYTNRLDLCHDCHAKIQGFIKTVKTGGSKYEWKAIK